MSLPLYVADLDSFHFKSVDVVMIGQSRDSALELAQWSGDCCGEQNEEKRGQGRETFLTPLSSPHKPDMTPWKLWSTPPLRP